MTLLPEKELAAVEAWYRDLQDVLGFAATTDRGRVLAGVRKLKEEAVTYQVEKRVVTTALGYKRWGDLYTYCVGKTGKTPAVELPETFSEVPSGWVLGDKKPTYDVAKKRLTRTLDLVKRVWVALGEKEEVNGADWVREERAAVESAFTSSTDPNVFEQRCYEFVTGYEEEDPTTVWVSAGEVAALSLENTTDLPAVAAFELLEFAEEKGVEVTKSTVALYEDTANPANWWFRYLLTAYLCDETRPTEEQQDEVRENAQTAAKLGLLYLDVRNKKPGQDEGWVEEASLSDLATAYHTYKEAVSEGTDNWTDLTEAVLLALGKTEEASKV
jgi:hypothetical protein